MMHHQAVGALVALAAIVVGLVTGIAEGSETVQRPRGDPLWDEVLMQLVGCMSTLAWCKSPTEGVWSTTTSKRDCIAQGWSWQQRILSGDDFFLQAKQDNGTIGVYLARVSNRTSFRDNLNEDLDTGEYLYCRPGVMFALLVGSQSDLASIEGVDFVSRLPRALKRAPHLDDLFATSSRETSNKSSTPKGEGHMTGPKRIGARILFAPSSQRRLEEYVTEMRTTVETRRQLNDTPAAQVDVHGDSIIVLGTHNAVQDALPNHAMAIFYDAVYEATVDNIHAAYLVQSGTALSSTDSPDIESSLLPVWQAGLQGEGQVIGVSDSGIDTSSCFFEDPSLSEDALIRQRQEANPRQVQRVNHRKIASYFTAVDGADDTVLGHGTHVAATIAGNPLRGSDDLSQKSQGMAPQAKLAFADIGNIATPGTLSIPSSMLDVFNVARTDGAGIHSNSWGTGVAAYSTLSKEIDEYTFANQDFLVLAAAGQLGPATSGVIQAPATSKNVLSVGSSMSSTFSFNERGARCPIRGRASECSQHLQANTSNGPTPDGRIAPDVVAPGNALTSAQSGAVCGTKVLSGTSMATAVLAGSAALIRQYLQEGRYPSGSIDEENAFTPSGALLKAMLINSAVGLDGINLDGGLDNRQGFGKPVLTNVLLVQQDNSPRNVFLEGDMDNLKSFSKDGETELYTFEHDPSKEGDVHVTLTWTDPAGSTFGTGGIVNDLDLSVEVGSTTYFPNDGTAPDSVNVVEHIVVPAADIAEAGFVRVVVRANQINVSPQTFALVVSGSIASEEEGIDVALVATATGLSVLFLLVVCLICKRLNSSSEEIELAPAGETLHFAPGEENQFVPAAGGQQYNNQTHTQTQLPNANQGPGQNTGYGNGNTWQKSAPTWGNQALEFSPNASPLLLPTKRTGWLPSTRWTFFSSWSKQDPWATPRSPPQNNRSPGKKASSTAWTPSFRFQKPKRKQKHRRAGQHQQQHQHQREQHAGALPQEHTKPKWIKGNGGAGWLPSVRWAGFTSWKPSTNQQAPTGRAPAPGRGIDDDTSSTISRVLEPPTGPKGWKAQRP
eukprot:CAMPEP_0184512280 /NCGR_PEP_ID=MMETSP0198_2-20121128/2792_1 /TAXON_ID=1112570 /ORGANISM="Thraustochytrium sp., Strain LLF1b" /LENGTH=1061 /DNA_ID=CAMNT_0026902285 /DNA_START=173 /DNA_END=3354 /DNA_ORIENTATION=-